MGDLPFDLETDTEARICADPDWRDGADWGEPRPGHPEGAVKFHVAEVLANVDRFAVGDADRRKLRLIGIVHDAFKHRVDPERPRVGENHHGVRARRFAEQYLDDASLLDIIELHDEAYNAFSAGLRNDDWTKADERAQRLLDRLGANAGLYLRFFRCDEATGSKKSNAYAWFEERILADPRVSLDPGS